MGTEKREEVIIRCDEKSCSTTIRWIQQEVAAKPEALPDAAWRLLTFATFDGQVKGFCSKTCLLLHLREFIPLKSPRELAEIAATEKLQQLSPLPPLPAFAGSDPSVVSTVPDATGHSGE